MARGSEQHKNLQPTVTVLQRIVPHYRLPFFERLAARLGQAGIQLNVLHGQERAGTVPNGSQIDASWAQRVSNIYADVGNIELVWQRGISKCLDSELIIVEQANRLLVNYLLHIKRQYSPFRLAYWGHGKNMQARSRDRLGERLKKRLATRADWWFAYTELSKQHLLACGYPEARVTVINNAVADEELRAGLKNYEHIPRRELATQLGFNGNYVALFCGSFYREKRLEFLFAAALRIRAVLPSFELILIGDGPQTSYVREMAAQNSWIRYVGPVIGAARAKYFRAAQMIMMPGLVGLVVVDSFVTRCPLFTTAFPFHSPEISYLESGANGVITTDDMESYVAEILSYLLDDSRLQALRDGCQHSAEKYSLASMVEKFANGIEQCLQFPKLAQSSANSQADLIS